MRSPTHSTVRLQIAWAKESKSNIGTRHLVAHSAEAIGAVEVTPDVGLHRLLQAGEAAVVTCALQPVDLTLSKILIAAADRLRHLDILDFGSSAERGIGRKHHVLEAARLTGTNIEDAADGWRGQQPHYHAHRIIDIDKIALLIAVRDALVMRLEQLHRTARFDVLESARQHAHHRALVIFIGSEHVEELQARPLRRQLLTTGRALCDGHVEQMLAPPVKVHWP